MILTVGGIKGGVGKTTLAVNLAIIAAKNGRDVMLIDSDPQGSATDFCNARRETEGGDIGFSTCQQYSEAVKGEGLKLSKRYSDIIIDVSGRDSVGQRAAMVISDLLVAPFMPSSFDLWPFAPLDKLIAEVSTYNEKLRCVAVMNKADSSGKDNEAAKEIVSEFQKILVSDCSIGNRKAFRSSSSIGLSVIEYRPEDKKASDEMVALYRFLFDTNMISK